MDIIQIEMLFFIFKLSVRQEFAFFVFVCYMCVNIIEDVFTVMLLRGKVKQEKRLGFR